MINLSSRIVGKNALLRLNRPEAANTINSSTAQELYRFLKKSENNRNMVIVAGNDDVFCSGYDVKLLVQNSDPNYGQRFILQQYLLNYVVATFRLPYIALIDGILMAGGAGISLHGGYRVATENTTFSMPQTAFGFFPDVGTCYFFSRMTNKLGYYLALTGAQLKGFDVVKAGLATHFCEKKNIPSLEEELLKMNRPTRDNIEKVLASYHSVPKDYEFSLNSSLKNIHDSFSATRVEQIYHNLENDKSDWANQTLKTLKKCSPTSLKITLKELSIASDVDIDLKTIFETDFRVAYRLCDCHDFKEGVRAYFVEKTCDPKWNPATLDKVHDQYIDSFFDALQPEDELKLSQ